MNDKTLQIPADVGAYCRDAAELMDEIRKQVAERLK